MKKLLVSFLVMLLLSTTIISAMAYTDPEREDRFIFNEDHPVFAEFCTSTGCGYCKYAHGALKNIYAAGDYPFSYVSLIGENVRALEQIDEYNVNAVPTVIFDGGYLVNVGAGSIPSAEEEYRQTIEDCLDRPVAQIDAAISVQWLGHSTMDISVSIQNNEPTIYHGHLRVYVTEIESTITWYDTGGNPYTFAFLDYAFNEDVFIGAGSLWSDSVEWNGYEHDDGMGHDFSGITTDNVMVIATVFNATWHQGYSYPPDHGPFDAYYVDDVAYDVPELISEPPSIPTTSGPISGKAGVEYTYTFSASDPEGNDVYYWIDWGDTSYSRWLGPYDSGTPIDISHTWNDHGVYPITAKAKDIFDSPSEFSEPYPVDIGASELEILDISGGLMVVQATVRNNRSDTLTNIQWEITVNGGLFGFIHHVSTGTIDALAAGKTTSISTNKPIFGLGKINGTIWLQITSPPIDLTKEFSARILGPFVLFE